ncbi:MAG: hypothetical protein ACK5JD_10125 [Mangrovibacterium sp.]
MNTFYFIAGPIAAGKTTLMDSKLYNFSDARINFFDHDKAKLMVQMYADGAKTNDISLSKALNNAISDSLANNKGFMIQSYFTNERLPQINDFLHKYKNKFLFEAHFISVDNIETLKERALKREKLGGHTSGLKSINKTYKQSFANFIKYLPQFNKTTFWDNSKEFGFNDMQPQFILEETKFSFVNAEITEFAKQLATNIIDKPLEYKTQNETTNQKR